MRFGTGRLGHSRKRSGGVAPMNLPAEVAQNAGPGTWRVNVLLLPFDYQSGPRSMRDIQDQSQLKF